MLDSNHRVATLLKIAIKPLSQFLFAANIKLCNLLVNQFRLYKRPILIHIQVHFYPKQAQHYKVDNNSHKNKKTPVCLCVCMKLKVSLTAELMWFYFTVNLILGPRKVCNSIVGWHIHPHEKTRLRKKFKKKFTSKANKTEKPSEFYSFFNFLLSSSSHLI